MTAILQQRIAQLAAVMGSDMRTLQRRLGNPELLETSRKGDIVSSINEIYDILSESGLLGDKSDVYYEHVQAVASDTWTIPHRLGKIPNVTILDSSGDEVEGDVSYPSVNVVTVKFSAPFSGKAFLN